MLKHFLYLIVILAFVTVGMASMAMSNSPVEITVDQALLDNPTDLNMKFASQQIVNAILKHNNEVVVVNWPGLKGQPIDLSEALSLAYDD